MIEDNESLELELISFFRASTVSRLHSCVWSFSACLARFARRTKKRETARSREQGLGRNAQPCKTGSYRSYPSEAQSEKYRRSFKSLSSVKRLIEKFLYMYRRFIITRFWTGTLSRLNCLRAWWERRRSWDSYFNTQPWALMLHPHWPISPSAFVEKTTKNKDGYTVSETNIVLKAFYQLRCTISSVCIVRWQMRFPDAFHTAEKKGLGGRRWKRERPISTPFAMP